MAELGDALRAFAARVDAGEVVAEAAMCAIVISDAAGMMTKATYIGRLAPPEPACIILLSRGIQQMVERAQQHGAPLGAGAARGSTH